MEGENTVLLTDKWSIRQRVPKRFSTYFHWILFLSLTSKVHLIWCPLPLLVATRYIITETRALRELKTFQVSGAGDHLLRRHHRSESERPAVQQPRCGPLRAVKLINCARSSTDWRNYTGQGQTGPSAPTALPLSASVLFFLQQHWETRWSEPKKERLPVYLSAV